jgi:hypothetical protein
MPSAAPRIDERLVAALARLERWQRPIAEQHRRLGAVAEHLGLPRPSYEQVRVIVHMLRARRRSPGAGEILLEIAFRVRPPEHILELFE